MGTSRVWVTAIVGLLVIISLQLELIKCEFVVGLDQLEEAGKQYQQQLNVQLQHQLQQGRFGPGSLKTNQCPNACTRRCSKTQYHKPCMFFCQKCCRKCLCVPPGYYGNKQTCACYNNWKTKRGGPKCP